MENEQCPMTKPADAPSGAGEISRFCTLRAVEIPTVETYVTPEGFQRFWYRWCQVWHAHGQGEGHRVAHCTNEKSPYKRTGYMLKSVGRWRDNPDQDTNKKGEHHGTRNTSDSQ